MNEVELPKQSKPSRETANLSALFFRGNYRDVLTLGLGRNVSEKEFPFLIGALGFNARKEEAEQLYLRRRTELSRAVRIACRFFLGISYGRHGDSVKARAYIVENLREGRRANRKGLTNRDRFFLMQGLGFYRYIRGQFQPALNAAENAWTSATLAEFQYGMALAGDLSAHALVQTGALEAGLLRFEEAERVAGLLGDGGLGRSIRMSRIVYRAQFGVDPRNILSELKDAFTGLDPQNMHAQANLLLEEAHQLFLRGQWRAASNALDETSTRIYRSQHRRYGNLLSLRLAEMAYRSGKYAAALHAVRGLRALLDESADRVLHLMAVDLEGRTARALSLSADAGTSGLLDAKVSPSENRIAQLMERLRLKSKEALGEILQSGYFGLLYEALDRPHSAQVIVLGLREKSLALLDAGEVIYKETGLSKQMQDLLVALSSGEKSKAELVEKVWGYRPYHPLRHDSVVFQAVSRLRELLGARGYWIEGTEGGYRLWSGIELSVLALPTERAPTKDTLRKERVKTPRDSESEETEIRWNERQTALLDWLATKQYLGVAECMKKFRVSEMTLRRDFSELLKRGKIRRLGRARATRYELIDRDVYASASKLERGTARHD